MQEEYSEFGFRLPTGEVRHPFGSLWKRFAAYAIDLIIFYFIFFQLFLFIYAPAAGIPISGDLDEMQSYMQSNPELQEKMFSAFIAWSFIILLYFTLFEKYVGYTLGKRLFKLKVVSIEGGELSFQQAFLRNISKSLFIPSLVLDIIPMFFVETRQRYTELLSRTVVLDSSGLTMEYEVYR